MDKTLGKRGLIKRKRVLGVKAYDMRVKRHDFRHINRRVLERVKRNLCFNMRSVYKETECILLHETRCICDFNAMNREVEKELRRVKVCKNIIRRHKICLCRSFEVVKRRECNKRNPLLFNYPPGSFFKE